MSDRNRGVSVFIGSPFLAGALFRHGTKDLTRAQRAIQIITIQPERRIASLRANCGASLFCHGWCEWFRARISSRWLVFENKEKLPEFPPLPLDRGSLGFIELLVLFEFDLRPRPVANPLVRQAEPVVGLAAKRVCRDCFLVSGQGFLKTATDKIQIAELQMRHIELGIDRRRFLQ